jgi:membrane protein DedA with SNARE-associated domain
VIGIIEKYAHAQMIYDMGAAQTGRILAALSILIFVGVWKTTLEYYGIPTILALAIGAISYFLLNFVIGLAFYKSGAYQKVLDVTNQNNKQWQNFLKRYEKDINDIKERL